MRRLTVLFLFLLIAQVSVAQHSAMTYNLRFSTPNDGENWWENRKAWVADLVNYYAPDVMGIQEGLASQVNYLDSTLIDYSFVGVGRDDGATKGEYSAVFYNAKKLDVIESGTFWLSETPGQVSVGWDASMERISSWAKFSVKETGEKFWVFNAHLDHIGPESRLNALKLVYQTAKDKNSEGLPVLVMGDFNSFPDAPPIQFLSSVMNDSRKISQTKPYGPFGTFNGFDVRHPLAENRIDYIFVNDKITVQKYAAISEVRAGLSPSDHLPVFINFGF